MIPAHTEKISENSKYRYLALGDSYTVGESVPADDCYPVQVVRMLRESGFHFAYPEIIAVTGWTTVDLLRALSARVVPEQPFNVVSLLIGVNNEYQGRSLTEYEEEFTRLLKKARQLAGGLASHVIVLSIPDYGLTPFGRALPGHDMISSRIDSFNEANRKISERHQARYLDITTESRMIGIRQELVAQDGLHYSGLEYAAWAAKLAAEMIQIVRGS
jgi:lysophospholipase L1-like esterase